jgi:hypothetical protein
MLGKRGHSLENRDSTGLLVLDKPGEPATLKRKLASRRVPQITALMGSKHQNKLRQSALRQEGVKITSLCANSAKGLTRDIEIEVGSWCLARAEQKQKHGLAFHPAQSKRACLPRALRDVRAGIIQAAKHGSTTPCTSTIQ